MSEDRGPGGIALSVAESLDPVLLARQAGLVLDAWQERALRDVIVAKAPRVLLNTARQSGKSTILALAGLIEAMNGDATVLLVSPSLRQSQEVFRRAMRLYRGLTRRIVEPEAASALRIEFESGGRLIALPGGDGDTIRGYSVDLLALDEAARISPELYFSVRPMVAVSGGRIVAASTPNGTGDWWCEAWHATAEDWVRYEVPASECPRLTPEFLATEAETMHPWIYGSEYQCRFQSAGLAAWFDPAEFVLDEGMETWT